MNYARSSERRWTPETAIAHVRERLAEQGRGCVDEAGRCHYIMADGRRCAVGWLLTEAEAWEAERRGLHATDLKLPVALVAELRAAHDDATAGEFAEDLDFELSRLSARWSDDAP